MKAETQALKPSEVLARAADLIEPEGCWTRHELARMAGGASVDPASDKAVCWCAAGAMQQVTGSGTSPAYQSGLRHLRLVTCLGVSVWNDAPSRTQSEVVTALRKASELARSEGQ